MNVVTHLIRSIELFSGVGMLGEGLRAGLEYLGGTYRTLCHVEREAYASAVLAARMEEGSLDAAPIWPDVTTFDAGQWHGKVDCIIAGFPCQDLSIAGQRAGLDGKRSGLFFECIRIADDSGAWCMFLENVAGIASATAAVVDEEEGELDERAAARVLGELADLGWNAEWITLSASDVGASHGRARWFCLAWRAGLYDAKRIGVLAHTRLQHIDLQQRVDGAEHPASCDELADPRSQRPQRGKQRKTRAHNGGGQEAHGSTGELCGLFAPSPADPAWADIIDRFPHLAPALEPTFRSVVNGLACDMDDSRPARLKCVGNGVVALQAAVTAVVLIGRAAE